MRRFFLIALVSVIVLVAITSAVGWYLLQDESFLKSQLSSLALKYTGRELDIRGPLNLDLGRETTLHASEIHYANAEWADQPDMVSIGKLLISFDISSLFSDQLVFPAIAIDNCVVSLERNEEFIANWDVIPKSDKPDEPEEEKEKGLPRKLPVWTKDIKINSCELLLTSPKLKLPLDIQIADLAMQHHDDSRWAAQGSGAVNKEAMKLDGWFAPFTSIIYGGPAEHELHFSLGKLVTLNSSGSVKDLSTLEGANLKAQLKGPEIADILNEFKLPLFSEGEFDYQLKLNTEGEMTRVDLRGDLGSVDIQGNGELDRLIKPTKGDVKFTVDGPNLGALAKILGVDGLVEDAFEHEAHTTFKDAAIHITKAFLKTEKDHLQIGGHINNTPGFAGSELDIQFRTDESSRWMEASGLEAEPIGSVSLDGKLRIDDEGLLAIDSHLSNKENKLDVEGTLGHLPDGFAPLLNVSFSTPDPTPLASLAGLNNIPAAPLAVTGQLGLKEKQLKLDNVKIDLAGDQAKIDGLLVLENRYAGSDLFVSIDIKNADDFGRLFGKEGLPNQPVKLSGEVIPDGKGLAFKVNDSKLGKIRIQLDGKIVDLDQPLGIDGNFDISLPRLSDIAFLLPDATLPDAPFSAKGKIDSKDKRVVLENVTVTLADNKANIDGHINLVDRYAGSKLNFVLDIQNTARLGRMFGKDGLPDQPLNLTASIQPDKKGLAFQVGEGNLGEIKLDLDGHIADLDKPMGVNAKFDIKLPSLRDISFLVPDRDLPDIPFEASGRLVNEQTKTRLEQVQMQIGRSKASIDGDLFPDNTFKLAVTAAGPDASRVGEVVGTSLPVAPYKIATAIQGSPKKFDLTGLSVDLGTSRATGNLKLGFGDATLIHGNVDSRFLNLSHWVPDDQEEQAEASTPAQKPKKEWMFDDTPVTALADHHLDLDLDVVVDKLDLGNTVLEDIKLEFVLKHRLIRLKPFTFKGTLGGSYNGEFSLDGTGSTPRLHLKATGKDVRAGLASAPGQDPTTYPPMDIDAFLDGVGATRREMASSLNGKYRGYLGKGQVANAGLDFFFSDFLTQLFNTLNPFAENSEYTQVDCAVFAAEAENGVVAVFPVILNTEQLTILSEGSVDLNTETIDLSFNTKPRTGIGLSAGALINPLIKVGGRLAAPAVEMDPENTLVSGGLAVATLGISVLAKSVSDRFLSSPDPCGDARKELAKRDSAAR